MNLRHVALSIAAAAHCVALGQGSWFSTFSTDDNAPWTERSAYATHLIHLKPVNVAMGQKGRFMYWGRNNGSDTFVTPFIWNPDWSWQTSGTITRTPAVGYEMFCAGQTLLKNGDPIICGAHFEMEFPYYAQRKVSTYSIATNTWSTRSSAYEMQVRRWYPTVTRMPDGEIVITGGQNILAAVGPPWSDSDIWPNYDPYEFNTNPTSTTSPYVLPSWSGTPVDWGLTNYPFTFPVSASQVFISGSGLRNHTAEQYKSILFNGLGNPSRTFVGGNCKVWFGSAVMYKPGFILKAGGTYEMNINQYPYQTANVESIDISNLNGPGSWETEQAMNLARLDHNLVLLPDGTVLALGGSTWHPDADLPGAVTAANNGRRLTPEIGKVDTAGNWTWTPCANAADIYRGYHSTAMLLPDGKVVLAGGDIGYDGTPGSELNPPTAQVFSPPYCSTGTRPKILSAPSQMTCGITALHNVTVDDAAVNKACLIALGAVTHGFDMNQRYIPLTVTGTGTTKTVHSPATTVQAPVGWYMLFVLKPDGNGGYIPCELAKYVEVVGDGVA